MNLQAVKTVATNPTTTVGKTTNTGLYVAIALILIAVLQTITGHPELFPWINIQNGVLLTLIPMLVAFLTNYLNRNVANT